ncbi:hypothetical protein DPMN_080849 [Dreissena polymorpha]|uniref:Uncharacterized protein n=1 Tax=Dreissena polymorpha TaxID=45954 RepID=A0A9D3Y5D4_DREPO|nr:hypothetical protein DPMN_080849 [Dreissena polymorpha]
MCNSENKTQLIELLLTEGSKDKYAPTLQRRRIFFVSGEKCICLSSEDGVKTNAVQVHELYSSQEEADTRIMLHLKHAAEEYSNKTIIVRSPDTDV